MSSYSLLIDDYSVIMSEFLVDGNNLAHELWDIRAISDDYDRRLVELLRQRQSNLGRVEKRVSKVTLFFDSGAGEGVPPGGRALKIRIAMPGDKADDLIIQYLNRVRQRDGSAAHITVVSNDKRVREAAKECGAKYLDCREFGRLLRQEPQMPVDEKEGISRADLSDIERAFLKDASDK
jgi:hypothetical protein